jgi:hypothetical protein
MIWLKARQYTQMVLTLSEIGIPFIIPFLGVLEQISTPLL